ncbi:MAG: hypothetical protein EXR21_05685 [Flavobacteriaceae bacterium]|nr:hypothetical protein [Flavobacteriaceae bacterium]
MIYEKLAAKKMQEPIVAASSSSPSTLVASSGYRYINPLVSCSGPVLETLPFKSEIENYIAGVKANGKANRVSVQFREMDNGYSFVVNGKENYFPASLMKVHTMVLLLKKEMKQPGFLEQKVSLTTS